MCISAHTHTHTHMHNKLETKVTESSKHKKMQLLQVVELQATTIKATTSVNKKKWHNYLRTSVMEM